MEAYEYLKKNLPDLLIVDGSMPGINGFDLVRMIRNNERMKDLPIIFLSGHMLEFAVDKALEAGANRFVDIRNLGELFIAIETLLT